MKDFCKTRVLLERAVQEVLSEQAILKRIRNPFITNLHATFQDKQNLYMVLDYKPGGTLRYHMNS